MNQYEFFNSPVHGIGCRAIKNLKKDELISIEPMVKINRLNMGINSEINNYAWGSKKEKNIVFWINGLGSFSNHSNDSNMYMKMKEEELRCEFYAKKDIEKGEELFDNYGKGWWQKRKSKSTNKFYTVKSEAIFKLR